MTKVKDENPVLRFDQPSNILPLLRRFSARGIHSLEIFSHHLSPLVYADQELMDNILALIGYSPRSKVRIIIKDSTRALKTDCPLVTLTRRIPSKASIRMYTEGVKDPDMGFFCIDKKHLIYFNDEASFNGFARTNARPESKKLLDEFERLWVYGSEDDPNLRQLCL